MKVTSRKLLAAALLAAIPMSSAFACTTANWTSVENGNGVVTGSPVADDPTNDVSRYSGECGLAGAAGATNFVTNNAPDGESTYRARFYVYTGSTGNTTVFRATAADNNLGAEVLRVDYNPPNFVFSQNGAAGTNVGGIVANKWYAIELLYDAGATFSAEISGNQTFTASLPATVPGAGTIESHSLGAITGGAGTVSVDAFESTRSADTPIGALCRGDANGDGDRNSGDGLQVRNEFLNDVLATGQPDCNEDGAVNSGDGLCVRAIFLGGNGACN